VAWDLLGGMSKVHINGMTDEDWSIIYSWMNKNVGHTSIGKFNDDTKTTHETIMKFLLETGI